MVERFKRTPNGIFHPSIFDPEHLNFATMWLYYFPGPVIMLSPGEELFILYYLFVSIDCTVFSEIVTHAEIGHNPLGKLEKWRHTRK